MNEKKIKKRLVIEIARDIEETKVIINQLEDNVKTKQKQIEKRFNRFVLTSLVIIAVLAIINITIEIFR